MFLLTKILSLLLKPVILIVVLSIIAMIIKNPKRKKRLLITSFAGLIFFTNPFIYYTVAISYAAKPVTLTKTYSVGIVLGGFLSYSPSRDQGRFSQACDRFIQTALLYKKGNIQKIIYTGGNGYAPGQDIQEATYIKNQFILLGIPAEDVYIEPHARNTYENAINTSRMVDSLKLSGPYVVITSAMHIPRAKRLFEKTGMNIVPYPSDFNTTNTANNFWDDYLIPSSFVLYNWESVIKEIVGLLVYKLIGKA